MAYKKKQSSFRGLLSSVVLLALIGASVITVLNSYNNKNLLQQTEEEITELETERDDLLQEVSNLEGLLEDSETTIAGLEQSITSKNTQIDDLASDLNEVMAQVETLEAQLLVSGSNVEELTAQLNVKLGELEQLQSDFNSLNDIHLNTLSQRDNLLLEIETKTQQINTLVDEVVRLQTELDNLKSFDVVWNLEEGFDYYEGFDYLFLGDIFDIAINNVQVFKNGLEIDSSIYRIWVNSIFNFINVHVHDIQQDKIVYSESLRYNPINTFGDFYNYPITIYSIDQLTPELFSINVRGETIIPTFGDYTQIENINFSQYSENYINLIYTYNEQIIENQFRVIVDPAVQFYQYDFSSDLERLVLKDDLGNGIYTLWNVNINYGDNVLQTVPEFNVNTGKLIFRFDPTNVGSVILSNEISNVYIFGEIYKISSWFNDRSQGYSLVRLLNNIVREETDTQIIYNLQFNDIVDPVIITITKMG